MKLTLVVLFFLLLLSSCSRSTFVPEQITTSPPVAFSEGDKPTQTVEPTETKPTASEVYFTPTPQPVLPTAANSPVPEPKFCSPLQDHTILDLREIVTQPFNPPPSGKDTGHHGVDFAYYRRGDRTSIAGVLIQSILQGKAAAVLENRIPYGNMIIVESQYEDLPGQLAEELGVTNGVSLYVLYAHMGDTPFLKIGDKAFCGQVLGEVGNTPTGWSSDPHLHLEARVGPPGVIFEAMHYYDTRAKPDEMANYERWRMSGEFELVDPLLMVEIGMGE